MNATSKISLPRKDHVWFAKPRAGTHPARESITLLSFLRDLLKVAGTAREAKILVKHGKVLVDGRVVKDPNFPIGFMDVIHIPDVDMTYRMELDAKGRLVAKRANVKHKLLRIIGKRTVKGGKQQISLADGRTLLSDAKYSVGDTLKLSLPEFKVISHYPLEVGSRCVVLDGKHAGEHGRITSMIPGTPNARAKVSIETDRGEKFIIYKDYIFVEGGE